VRQVRNAALGAVAGEGLPCEALARSCPLEPLESILRPVFPVIEERRVDERASRRVRVALGRDGEAAGPSLLDERQRVAGVGSVERLEVVDVEVAVCVEGADDDLVQLIPFARLVEVADVDVC
jgi:hypothetical protein